METTTNTTAPVNTNIVTIKCRINSNFCSKSGSWQATACRAEGISNTLRVAPEAFGGVPPMRGEVYSLTFDKRHLRIGESYTDLAIGHAEKVQYHAQEESAPAEECPFPAE